MDRRSFLNFAAATGLTVGLYKASANASVPEHNWDKYDWGSGPPVRDRLYQGPFPQYGPAAVVPESDVSMVTSPSKDIVSNYGMGLMVYASDDTGPLRVPGQTTGTDTRRSDQAALRAEDLHPTQLARCPETARPARLPGMVEDHFRPSPPLRQAHRFPRDAGESRLPRSGYAGFSSQKGSLREAQG